MGLLKIRSARSFDSHHRVECAVIVVIMSHRTRHIKTSYHSGFTVSKREDALERSGSTSIGGGEGDDLVHDRSCSRGLEACDHKRWNRERVGCRMPWKDSASVLDVKEYRATLNDRNVSDKAIVAGQRVKKRDIVLAFNDKAGNVEGSKLHPSVHVLNKIPAPR